MDSLEIGVLYKARKLEGQIPGTFWLDENIYLGKGCFSILDSGQWDTIITIKSKRKSVNKCYMLANHGTRLALGWKNLGELKTLVWNTG